MHSRAEEKMVQLFHGVDPMTEKHPDYNPFVYTANNPIRFIDPNEQDWYEDECSGKMQWFEGSVKQNGFKHRGAEFQSGKDLYRKDGSVLFGSHSNAVNYMNKFLKGLKRRKLLDLF